jgi:Tol biopolymer transport system component
MAEELTTACAVGNAPCHGEEAPLPEMTMNRKLLVPLVLIAAAAVPFAQQQPKVSTIFQLTGHRVYWPAATRDGNRIYYERDSSEVHMYDRTTRRHTRVFAGRASEPEVSAAGDKLVFVRKAEDGDASHVWTVALDPRTGLATGSPRRVSLSAGYGPSFSPDGRSIAFAVGPTGEENDLVVVPTTGGPERVVVRKHGAITPVRWSADGQWLFYGSNADTKKLGAVNATFRVPVSGGTPQRVLDNGDWGAYPGLSPDGRTLVTWSPAWDSIVVSTPEGKRLTALSIPAGELEMWIDGSRGLFYNNNVPRQLNVVSLAAGRTRFVTDSAVSLTNAVWSPDGRRIAAVPGLRTFRGLAIIDESGAIRRLPTSKNVVLGVSATLSWSPDGRRIAYRSAPANGPLPISSIEVATGVERQLVARSSRSIALHWTTDGRALMYGLLDTTVAPDSTRTMEIRQVSMTGGDRLLRRTQTTCRPVTEICFRYLTDSTILTWSSVQVPGPGRPTREYRVLNLRDNAPGALVFTRSSAGQPNPAVSENGRWIAIRELGADGQWTVHVLSADGATKRSMALPAAPVAGPGNPHVSNDGSEVMFTSQGTPDAKGGAVYRVAVATGKATRLLTLPARVSQAGQWTVAPDGKSIGFMTTLEPRGTVYEIDLSDLLRKPGGTRP